jgi:hypothetical protein
MINSIAKITFVLAVFGFLSACSANQIYHEDLMAGQVVRADANQVVLCIGSEGSAEEGMTFNAFHITSDGSITGDDFTYSRTLAGTVVITEIIDRHFARAEVMSGNIQKNDMVELKGK